MMQGRFCQIKIGLSAVFPKKIFVEDQSFQSLIDTQLQRHLVRDSDYEAEILFNPKFGILYLQLDIIGEPEHEDLVCGACEQDLEKAKLDFTTIEVGDYDPFVCAICKRSFNEVQMH